MSKRRRVVSGCAFLMLSMIIGTLAWAGPQQVASAATKGYHVTPGPIFNSASGPNSAKYAINNHLKGAINHAPHGSTIRIMSWNIMSRAATDSLLRAQRRGVRVLVLMDASNWSNDVPNPQFRRLKNGLAAGNKGRAANRKSVAKVCHGSCRGSSGSAHSKMYLFSWSGKDAKIVMEGSANFTLAAATNQWNDIFTWVGNTKLYNFAVSIFAQMWHDKKVANPWQYRTVSPFTLAFSPESGNRFHGDPVTKALSAVKCTGAKNGNANHHTVIRFFPDVMRGNRGLRNAKQLKSLWNAGCDVKVGYTVMSYKAHQVLTAAGKRGRVPLHHMAADNNGDGQFDKYFHLKSLTINGVIGSNRKAYRLIQGSSNASGLSTISDENIATITKPRSVLRYQEHMNYWFNHAPKAPAYATGGAGAAARLTTPNAVGFARLRTPQGTRAAASDGYIAPGTKVVSPLTGKVVDPYALIDSD
ncbi:phosphatidylserine/phosphatidylglycerophosphate/cardiolipin synthase family protein [Nocardioides sp. DS6]|uniref:phospholipase D n=1 Tax=Nocardioides eburneus TaxID=3231482 RepID=A0ABV3SVU9_9ACTN